MAGVNLAVVRVVGGETAIPGDDGVDKLDQPGVLLASGGLIAVVGVDDVSSIRRDVGGEGAVDEFAAGNDDAVGEGVAAVYRLVGGEQRVG